MPNLPISTYLAGLSVPELLNVISQAAALLQEKACSGGFPASGASPPQIEEIEKLHCFVACARCNVSKNHLPFFTLCPLLRTSTPSGFRSPANSPADCHAHGTSAEETPVKPRRLDFDGEAWSCI